MARKKRNPGNLPRHSGAEFQIPPAALRFAVPALVVFFSVFAWTQRGVYEDGFFYLRVVDVFLHSGVLAYNPAERYETNTDFLWTVLLIPGPAAGVDDILWMHIVGVAVYAAALCAAFSLARKLLSDSDAALVALVLLGGHYSFAHFAVTGFAPHLQALAALCCLLALMRFGESASTRNGAALGLALLFLALCRLDSAVFGIPLVLCVLFLAWRNGKAALPAVALATGIPSVLFGGVLLWKLSYYGDILPATYYAKAAVRGDTNTDFFLARGASYAALYWQRYFLWAPAGVAAWGAWKIFKAKGTGKCPLPRVRPALLWTMAAMCACWHLYMLRNGGDLTEFRFLMPQTPMMMILAAAGLRGLARQWRWMAAGGAVFLSLLHWQTAPANIPMPWMERFSAGAGYGSNSLPRAGDSFNLVKTKMEFKGGIRETLPIQTPPETPFQRSILTGTAFRDLFETLGKYPPEVRVAFTAGGAPAYAAPLLWTEMRGWADSRISNADTAKGEIFVGPPTIGHSVLARPKLLARLGVNLVTNFDLASENPPNFSRPQDEGYHSPMAWALAASSSPRGVELPPDSAMFLMPMPGDFFIPVLYFNRNETIDRILDERGIERVNVF